MTQVTISIPTPLRAYTENIRHINIDFEGDVNQALQMLISLYPPLRNHLYDGDTLRKFVNIYVNDEDIRYLDNGVNTILHGGEKISIIPAIAGGLN